MSLPVFLHNYTWTLWRITRLLKRKQVPGKPAPIQDNVERKRFRCDQFPCNILRLKSWSSSVQVRRLLHKEKTSRKASGILCDDPPGIPSASFPDEWSTLLMYIQILFQNEWKSGRLLLQGVWMWCDGFDNFGHSLGRNFRWRLYHSFCRCGRRTSWCKIRMQN